MTKKSLKKAWKSNASRKSSKRNKSKDKHRKSRKEIASNPNNVKRQQLRLNTHKNNADKGGVAVSVDVYRDRNAAHDLSREENFCKLKFETVMLSSAAANMVRDYLKRQEAYDDSGDSSDSDDDDSSSDDDDGVESVMAEFGDDYSGGGGGVDGDEYSESGGGDSRIVIVSHHRPTDTRQDGSDGDGNDDLATVQRELLRYGFERDDVLAESLELSKVALVEKLFCAMLENHDAELHSDIAQLRAENALYGENREELEALIQDEITALESIFEGGMNVERDEGQNWIIRVDIDEKFGSGNASPWQLHIYIPSSSLYPYEPPICLLYPQEGLPPLNQQMYRNTLRRICLAMTRECLTLSGAGVVFSIHYFLKENGTSLFAAEDPQSIAKDEHSRNENERDVKIRSDRRDHTPVNRSRRGGGQDEKRQQQQRNRKRQDLSDDAPEDVDDCDISEEKLSERLWLDYDQRRKKPQFQQFLKKRSQLPAFLIRKKIMEMVSDNQVIIISGETGCGKTTQVPQLLLDDMVMNGAGAKCSILVTQPRRLSAIGVAERVAKERCVPIGGEVGYAISLESRRGRETRLTFCTTGIMLKILENNPALDGYSHIIVDEVHERSVDSDFLLIVLRDLLPNRPDLKLVLMSATLNANRFSEYFYFTPTLHIPGRTFPVKSLFLEDIVEMCQYSLSKQSPYCSNKENEKVRSQLRSYSTRTRHTMANIDENKINYELITMLVRHILKTDTDTNNAILIFMPGLSEITDLYNELNLPSSSCDVIALHSSLSSINQRKVFDPPKPGVRKVVIATNIAETSITIDDVFWVIDTGKMKEMEFDSASGMNTLKETWISRANALQRAGRAGRVKPGTCFHLFSKHRFDNLLEASQRPEILRISLEQTCLRIKALDLDGTVESVLAQAMDPPKKRDITHALRQLRKLNALRHDETLTPLGMHLTQLPIDARLGKMIIFGALFRCLDPILTIGATLGYQSPFVAPMNQREEARKAHEKISVEKSDHLSILRAYHMWIKMRREGREKVFCDCHYLSLNTLRQITERKKQLVELLSSIGFLELTRTAIHNMRLRAPQSAFVLGEDHPMNLNSRNLALIKACLCAGLYPQVLLVQEPNIGDIKFLTGHSGPVDMHPSSVLHKAEGFENGYLVYMDRVKTSKVFIRDATMVSPYALMIFGERYEFDRDRQMIVLDGWARLRCSRRVALLMFEIRQRVQLYIRRQIDDPQFHLSEHATDLIDIISVLLGNEKSIHNDLWLEQEIFGDDDVTPEPSKGTRK